MMQPSHDLAAPPTTTPHPPCPAYPLGRPRDNPLHPALPCIAASEARASPASCPAKLPAKTEAAGDAKVQMTDILRITELATRKLGVECPVGHREPQALPQRQGNPTAMTMILQNGEKIPSAQPFGMTAPVPSTSTVKDSP